MALRIRKPPQHKVDAPIVYIDPKDDAWKREEWECEIRDLLERNEEAGQEEEDASEHPMRKYFSGLGRYDLDAPGPVGGAMRTPRSYLDMTKSPTQFVLRRLNHQQYHEVLEVAQTQSTAKAELLACRYGIKSCNALDFDGASGGFLTSADMEKLDYAGGDLPDGTLDRMLAHRIGNAVFMASHTLSADEKKA